MKKFRFKPFSHKKGCSTVKVGNPKYTRKIPLKDVHSLKKSLKKRFALFTMNIGTRLHDSSMVVSDPRRPELQDHGIILSFQLIGSPL
jgi:hypothetical protein